MTIQPPRSGRTPWGSERVGGPEVRERCDTTWGQQVAALHTDIPETLFFLLYISLCIAEQRVLEGAPSLPPGPGLEETGYCQPVGPDLEFMANSRSYGTFWKCQAWDSPPAGWKGRKLVMSEMVAASASVDQSSCSSPKQVWGDGTVMSGTPHGGTGQGLRVPQPWATCSSLCQAKHPTATGTNVPSQCPLDVTNHLLTAHCPPTP